MRAQEMSGVRWLNVDIERVFRPEKKNNNRFFSRKLSCTAVVPDLRKPP